jgi:hypothetical protein
MRSVLLILSFFLASHLFAQPFSSDPAQFLKEINKYLGASNSTKTKEFMDVFEPNWLTNFSAEYQKKVVATCNLIASKGLSAFPDMYGYLLSVHSFVQTNQPKQSFESWHSTIDQLLNSKKVTKFQEFIEVCAGFFTDGTVYYETDHKWQITGGTYTFDFSNTNPVIKFENVKMACYIIDRSADKKDNPYIDSTIVRGTNGTYEPLINKWTGRGGKVDWAKSGLDPANNYAIITDYMLSLKSTEIESDSSVVYTDYYDTPLEGSFRDVAKKSTREIDRINPQFISFSKKVVRKTILPDVDYVGGFAIKGANFNGIGYDNEPASLVFYKEGGIPFVKANALSFNISEKGATASECRITMYLSETDSIFHPGLILRYVIGDSATFLSLERYNEGIAQAPFKNSFHNMDMYVDKIIWNKKDPNLVMDWHPNAKKIAKFESENYFSERVYSEIQGMNQKHPLVAIYQHAYRYDIEVIPIGEAATAMGFTKDQAIPILVGLANKGFITYNKNKDQITLLPKTKKYIDARSGKSDYDHIVITSNVQEFELPDTIIDGKVDRGAVKQYYRMKALNERKDSTENFGTINLKSLDMYLNEVEPVEISPIQNVVIFPDGGKLVVKQNLDFTFTGAVMAGKLEVYLDQASFDYTNFRINLLAVDAALFRVKPIYGGSSKLVPMESHFEGLKGYIAIDDPGNRSGKDDKKFHNYPILKSKETSYVFYDDKSIYNSVYDSATFYFKADAFDFDSLDNFDEYSMKFPGEFRSSGIFPAFRETLTIQEDYSFGFKTKAPEGGFKFYGDYAKFDNEIKLSNEGLRGAGQIDFVTSTSISENFIFFPDSTMGLSSYVNRGQTKKEGAISVPDVTGNNIMVTFVPKDEILKARAVKEPLMFFNKEAAMLGITYLTPDGMTGRGLMYFKEAELGSRNFEYERWVINADTADFNLVGVGEDLVAGEKNPLAVSTKNVQAHVDFESRRGEFKRNDGKEFIELPKNQYICYMDMITWLMDQDEMELSKSASEIQIDTELGLNESNFFSTHPDQDSLNFAAPKARYSMKDYTIYCEKVDHIDVADARIFPADQKVTVRKKAEMDPFDGAKILANSVTKYHTITEAHVEILSAKKYQASGKYPYIDSKGTEQIITFADIKPQDSTFQTTATGQITQQENFHLSEQFDFYGTVELFASEQFLTFNGATRINHGCNQFARNWLKFRAAIDPNNIQIPVSEQMTDLEGNPIAVGIVKRNSDSPDTTGIYPAFLSKLERPDDHVMFNSFGVLNYNDAAKEFRIASPEKLINRAEKGNYISLHIESCSMEGDGLVDLGMDLPGVEFITYGTLKYDAANKETSMNLSGGLNFFYDKKAIEYMTNAINAAEGISGIDWDRTTLSQAIKEQVDEKTAENMKADYTIKGASDVKIPKELESYAVYLTNLRFKWDNRVQGGAFVSQPITGIVSLYGVPILKDFTVRMAIQYVRSGDRGTKMGFFVELPGKDGLPGYFYFYSFERIKKSTVLKVYSTDKELQGYLGTLKEEKTKGKDLEFMPASNYSDPLSDFKYYWGGQ